jgi:hypothetical protein
MNTYAVITTAWGEHCAALKHPPTTDQATHVMLASIAAWADGWADPISVLGNLARILEIASEAMDDHSKAGM